MSAMIHFGTDGWRARLDGDFTEDNVVRIADAAGKVWTRRYPGAIVYVGYDTRPGAERFARVAALVLGAHGLAVKLSDRYVPTPALSWTVAHDARACGGLMITGSHNPGDYSGVKLRVSDGGVGSADFYEEVEREIDLDPTDARGAMSVSDLITPYLDHLVTLVDAEKIAAAHLHVVYDPMYGSARGYLADAMRVLGVEVEEIRSTDDIEAEEIHPEPIEPWVDECEQAVVESGACAGLINDGDGDRLGAVDERGRYVSSQKLSALILGHLYMNRGQSGRVVLSLSASTLVRRVAKSLGCRLAIKPIGYNYIYEEMLKGDVLFGAEETGGFGIPGHMPERDGLLMNLLLCELMAETGKPLGELVDMLEQAYGHQCYARRDLRLESEVIEMLRTLLPGLNPPVVAGMKPVAVSHMDGLRLEFEDESWMLLRPSGTEPLVRVYAEAPSIELRDALLDAGSDIARGELS